MTISGAEKSTLKPALCARASGFTLIEILVALVIVAILFTISYPIYKNYIDKATVTLGISTLETVRKTLESFYVEHNEYPPDIDLSTGGDGHERIVLDPALLAEFKSNLFSLESYTATKSSYTLTAKAKDSNHSILVLTQGQAVIQGP